MGGGAGIPGVFQRSGLGPEQGVSRHKGNAGSTEGSRKSAVSGNLQTGGVCKKILDHFDMAEYFDFIGGAIWGKPGCARRM